MYLVGDEQLLIDRMSIRTPILVLGAGFSKGIQSQDGKPLPAGHELAEELFNEVLSKSKTVKKEDLEDYWAERSDLKKTCDNIEMEHLVEQRDRFLQKRFSGCRCLGGDFHMFLLDYPWRHIFTLNIDDLVEAIYSNVPAKQRPLVHVKQCSTLHNGTSLELYKLHGSVNRPDLGFVFDSAEYRNYEAIPSWALNTFGYLSLTNDVVFLGTEFQEEDLQLIIQQLNSMVEIVQPPHYFFVSPKINNRKLVRKIKEKWNMHFIPWTAQKFLTTIKDRIAAVGEARRKMRDYGMVFYDEQVPADENKLNQYMSELYMGAPPRPYDFIKNIDIIRPQVDGRAKALASKGKHHLVAIYGEAYVGKTCAAIRLGVDLMRLDYEFSVFNLPYSMNATAYQERIIEYLEVLPEGAKVAILAERMSYYYNRVKDILNKCPPNVSSLIFICTGSLQDHNSKKYLLDSYESLEEVYISEKTKDGRQAANIYDKLEETTHLNNLRLYGNTRKECIDYIRKLNDLIDVLYTAQEGRQFVSYFSDMIERMQASQNKTAFLILSTFGALDISEISAALFSNILSGCGLEVDMHKFALDYADLIRLQDDRISIRCSRLLWASVQTQLDRDDLLSWINFAVRFLARNLSEQEETVQNEIFQKLLKIKSLRKQLQFDDSMMLNLFLQIEKVCKHLSYYWVQRGILHRDMEHFEEANNAFSEAAAIRNNTSYHVKHAQAKNYMTWGVWGVYNEPQHAQYYFDIGKKQIEELIEKASYRYFAYSVHTYVDMMIKYHSASGEGISDAALLNMAQLLLRMPDVYSDRLGPSIVKKFSDYCGRISWKNECLTDLDNKYNRVGKGINPGLAECEFDSDDIVVVGNDEIAESGQSDG